MFTHVKLAILVIALPISTILSAQPGAGHKKSIKQLAAGSNHYMALLDNGTLWAWGDNAGGQLGDSSTTDRNNPLRVGPDSNWAVITTGQAFTHAVKTDGTLWGWGINKTGQLGISTQNLKYMYTTPVQIGRDNDWQMVSSGAYFTVGLKTDGTIWVWGTSMYHLMHDKNNQYEPLKIDDKNNKDWKQVAAGDEFFMAMKTDGTIWTKGMINNTLMNPGGKKVFLKVNNDTDWVSMDAGKQHAMAIKSDGTLWAWGANDDGQLGNGTTVKSKDPVKIGENFAAVSATNNYTVAIKKNGDDVWWWGKSWISDKSQPKPIMAQGTSNFDLIAAGNKSLLLLIDNLNIMEFSGAYEYGNVKQVK